MQKETVGLPKRPFAISKNFALHFANVEGGGRFTKPGRLVKFGRRPELTVCSLFAFLLFWEQKVGLANPDQQTTMSNADMPKLPADNLWHANRDVEVPNELLTCQLGRRRTETARVNATMIRRNARMDVVIPLVKLRKSLHVYIYIFPAVVVACWRGTSHQLKPYHGDFDVVHGRSLYPSCDATEPPNFAHDRLEHPR